MHNTSPRPRTAALLKATSYTANTPGQSEATGVTAVRAVAISREAGALGASVGQEVASRLGWRLYDQALLDQIADEMGLQSWSLDTVDERPRSLVRDLLAGLDSRLGASSSCYAHHLLKTLDSLAARGECVVVGRGAAHILPAESTLRVRLVAPRAFRIAAIQQDRGMTAEEAGRWIDATDRERVRFVKEYPGKDATDPGLYDLVLNVSRFTIPQAAGIIIDALRALEQARTQPRHASVLPGTE